MKSLLIQILFLLLLSATLSSAQENWVNLITPQHIHEIYEIDNKLYCATEGGLIIYDQATQTIERQLITDDIPSHRVEDITQDAAGNIWIGTYDNGLARMTDDGWEKLPLNNGLNQIDTYCIEYDNDGTLWVGTITGLYRYENDTWDILHNFDIWDMAKDEQGTIHMASFKPAKVENGIYTEYEVDANSYGNSRIDYGPNGEIYWSTDFGEVAIYDGAEWTVHTADEIGLPNMFPSPTDILRTSTGDVWAGFGANGIYKFDGTNWTEIYTTDDYMTQMQFVETSTGDIIISIDSKLYEYDNGLHELADISIGFNDNNVKIAKNENNEMLVLSDGQVIKYDAQFNPIMLSILPDAESYERFDFLPHDDGSIGFINTLTGDSYHNGEVQANVPVGYPMNTIGAVDYLVDSRGDYWLATARGLIRNHQGMMTVYDSLNSPFISDQSVDFDAMYFLAVVEDRNGDIWASNQYGVGRWDSQTETWEEYHSGPLGNVSNIGPSCIYFDENNVLWAGTKYMGLSYLDGDTWTSYTTQNSNLASYFINDIQEINGQLVLATQEGMSIFDGTDFTNFNRENSGIGSEYSNKIEIDVQGNIWITAIIDELTGHGGISIYNSNGIALNTQEASANTPTPIHLFPNPAKTFFQIDSELMQEMPVQIQVFDLTGRLIKSVSNSPVVHTHDMPAGMYAVLVLTDERQYAAKVLITEN